MRWRPLPQMYSNHDQHYFAPTLLPVDGSTPRAACVKPFCLKKMVCHARRLILSVCVRTSNGEGALVTSSAQPEGWPSCGALPAQQ
jgi:hypothetical protein